MFEPIPLHYSASLPDSLAIFCRVVVVLDLEFVRHFFVVNVAWGGKHGSLFHFFAKDCIYLDLNGVPRCLGPGVRRAV